VPQSRRGYTLLEVLLVMAVMVLLSTIALPSLYTMYADEHLGAGVDGLRAALSQARNQALEEGPAVPLRRRPGQGQLPHRPGQPRLLVRRRRPPLDQPERAAAGPRGLPARGIAFTDDANSATPEWGADTALSPGTATPDQWATVLVFLPDGSLEDDGTVGAETGSGYKQMTLRMAGANPVVVRVRTLTGVVTARVLRPGEDGP